MKECMGCMYSLFEIFMPSSKSYIWLTVENVSADSLVRGEKFIRKCHKEADN